MKTAIWRTKSALGRTRPYGASSIRTTAQMNRTLKALAVGMATLLGYIARRSWIRRLEATAIAAAEPVREPA